MRKAIWQRGDDGSGMWTCVARLADALHRRLFESAERQHQRDLDGLPVHASPRRLCVTDSVVFVVDRRKDLYRLPVPVLRRRLIVTGSVVIVVDGRFTPRNGQCSPVWWPYDRVGSERWERVTVARERGRRRALWQAWVAAHEVGASHDA